MKAIKIISFTFLICNLSIASSNSSDVDSNYSYLYLFESTKLPIPECMDISIDYNGKAINRLNFDRNHHKHNSCENEFAIEYISLSSSNRYDIDLKSIKNKLYATNQDVEVTIVESLQTHDSVSIFITQKSNNVIKDNLTIEILMADSSVTHIEKSYCGLLNVFFNKNKKLSQNILVELNCVVVKNKIGR